MLATLIKKITLFLLMGILLLLTGCSHNTLKEKNTILNRAKVSFGSVPARNSYLKKSEQMMRKKVQASFVNSTVYYAVSQVAQSIGVPFDQTFRPSSQYRVTVNFDGTLGEFLRMIYIESGIRYKYRNGILKVFNQEDVEKSYRVKMCQGAPSIKIALDDVVPMEFFKYMNANYNQSFRFDTRFYGLKGVANDGKTIKPKVSFYYKGCDKKEVLREFSKAIDLRIVDQGNDKYAVYDYEVAELDLPTYYNVQILNSGGGIGASSSGSNSSGGQNSLSLTENFHDEFGKYIEKYKSKFGKVYVSNRGYVVVEDKPSIVKKIKKLIRAEKQRQSLIDLSVTIVRVDVSDNMETGVDWNAAFNNIANSLQLQGVDVGINMASEVTNGFTISGGRGKLTSMVSALQTYGKTKIVRSLNSKTRSGIPSNFKVVDQIPYVISSSINNNGTSQVSTEAKVAEAGLTITLTPTLMDHGELVNIAAAISVSEYKGDKTFNVNGGEYKLPQISTNDIQMPVSVRLDDSIILTGFKFNKRDGINEGIPGASQLGGVLGGLFGHSERAGQDSEFLIIITPRSIKDY